VTIETLDLRRLLTEDAIADLTARPARPERTRECEASSLARPPPCRGSSPSSLLSRRSGIVLRRRPAGYRGGPDSCLTDFAYDLLDAHMYGFSAGDWQAAEGLAHALVGSDWPPDWKRDSEDAAHIIVDPLVWPTSGSRDTAEDAEPGSPS